MDLWIRSQDGECLWKANAITIQDYAKTKAVTIVVSSGVEQIRHFATYNTKEKALKVLDEIQNLLIDRYVFDKEYYLGSDVFIPGIDAEIKALPRTCVVYQMPADNGVDNAN